MMRGAAANRRRVVVAAADPAEAAVSVASYNVLAAKKVQVRRAEYSHCVPHVLNFAVRKTLLLAELKTADCDVCCLQSVDHFEDWWQPQLSLLGYDGVFTARSGGIPGEGVAVFFKRHLFQLFKTQFIDFSAADEQLLSAAEKIRRGKKHSSIPNNVGILVGLQPWEHSKHPSAILVANVELDDARGGAGILKRNNQCLYFFQQVERFNAELHLPLVMCGTFNCTPGDATHQIITTGRLPYSKKLPAPAAAPLASSPSYSSIIVRWSAPKEPGDHPIIGYRLVRRAGGSQKMGFGKDMILDENTFKVVVTGLSSGTVYEFRVAAITSYGTSPLSAPSQPLSTLTNRKNPPLFANLRKRVEAAGAGRAKDAVDGEGGGASGAANLHLPKLGASTANSSHRSGSGGGGGGREGRGNTGLTPRFEDDHVIGDAALTFDHTHGRPAPASERSGGGSDAVLGAVEADAVPEYDPSVPVEKRRTVAAMEGRDLPYGDLPMGERFDNAVHSLNLQPSYSVEALPPLGGAPGPREMFTLRGRNVVSRADYLLSSARQFRVVEVLDLPDPCVCWLYTDVLMGHRAGKAVVPAGRRTFRSSDPRVPSHIPDPSRHKPADWDDREFVVVRHHRTGETEDVLNPNFCGVWEAPLIRNPKSEHDRLPTTELASDHVLLVACLQFQRKFLAATWE